MMEIGVCDNGMGFCPEQAAQLFQTFERLHQDDGIEGHGLGLASVRKIVEQHGGRVWAEGHPGQGACFWFSLKPATEE
jgi:signal transduction histidine kinase